MLQALHRGRSLLVATALGLAIGVSTLITPAAPAEASELAPTASIAGIAGENALGLPVAGDSLNQVFCTLQYPNYNCPSYSYWPGYYNGYWPYSSYGYPYSYYGYGYPYTYGYYPYSSWYAPYYAGYWGGYHPYW
jgi:hypothetical protein